MQSLDNITEELSQTHIKHNVSNGKNNILPNSFSDFTYSRKDHLKYFNQKKYDLELFGREITPEECDSTVFQNLLIYGFIKENVPLRSKILEIGNRSGKVFENLKNDYECWNIPDPESLIEETAGNRDQISITKFEDNRIRLKNYYGYFDFVFSISAFENVANDKSVFSNILFNLNRFLKNDSYCIHNFPVKFGNGSAQLNRFLLFLYNNTKNDSKILNKFVPPGSLKTDPGLLYFEAGKPGTAAREKGEKNKSHVLKNIQYNILIKKNIFLLPVMTKTKPSEYLNKTPAYIFHHLIKCGGSSAVNKLFGWFNMEFDHLVDSLKLNEHIKFRYNMEIINSDTCVVSHFAHNGAYLHQRYPEIITKKDTVKTFIFVREPMKFSISLYYYIRNQGRFQNIPLLRYLKYNRNIISGLIPCDESNYKEVMDRYFFIGITEHMQESFDKLAGLLKKKKVIIPVINKSTKDSQISKITPEIKKEFKENNKLDYMVYEYCLEKFRSM